MAGNTHQFESLLIDWLRRRARLLTAIYWPVLAVGTHYPQIQVLETIGPTAVQPDKILHFTGYTLLTTLLVYAQPLGRSRTFSTNLVGGTWIVAAYAYLDEATQQMFGRVYSSADLLVNLTAVWCVLVAMLTSHSRPADLPVAAISPIRKPPRGNGVQLARASLGIVLPLVILLLFGRDYAMDLRHLIGYLPGITPHPTDLIDAEAHFWGSALAMWLVAGSKLCGQKRFWMSLVIAIVIVGGSGPVIEFIQMLVGRSSEWRDVQAHEWGAVAGLGVYLLFTGLTEGVCFLRRRHRAIRAISHKSNEKTGQFIGNAVTVSLLTLVSRITGLIRDAVMGSAFGLTGVLSAFCLAFMVPNLFRRLFGEGALSAAFIPNYSDWLKKDPEIARRLASLCLGMVLLVTASLTLGGEVLLAVLTSLGQDRCWSAETMLAFRLTIIMLPYMPMVCLVALIGGMLQVRGKFGPTATTPILLNLIVIGSVLFATSGIRGDEQLRHVISIVAVGVLVAGAAQLIWQFAALLRIETIPLRWAGAGAAMRPILAMMLPMLIGLAVFQVNAMIDMLIAFGLAPAEKGPPSFELLGRTILYPITDRGAVAALAYAQRLYQFPLGVFGIAIATAIFPALARAAPTGNVNGMAPLRRDHHSFRGILQHGLRLTMFIGLPASVGLMIVRLPLTRIIFEYGEFDMEASRRVGAILAAYASAVWAYSMTHVIIRAFYAVKDTTTPLKISVMMVMFNLVLNLVLVWFLQEAGLAWSTAVSAAVQVMLLLWVTRRYLDKVVDRQVWWGWTATTFLTAVMAMVLLAIMWLFDDVATLTRNQVAFMLATLVVAGAVVYLGGARILRCPELNWLRNRSV